MAGDNSTNDDRLLKALMQVPYPGFDMNIVEANLVTEARLEDNGIAVVHIRPIAAPPEVSQAIEDGIAHAVAQVEGVTELALDFPEPPKPKSPNEHGPKAIPGVKAVVPVASGKGGVGKSTVAVNLALALTEQGFKVGLLDLDLYGPSIPKMMGLENAQPNIEGNKILPLVSMGVEVLSIGFLVPPDAALIWRGPMVAKAVKQLLFDTKWSELDILVLDLPPGTGDIQISLAAETLIAGAVVVATPQDVALADVIKAVDMFRQVKAPILGVVENMSYFVCPDCSARHEIFGHGSVKPLAAKIGVPFLGEIPLDPAVPGLEDHGQSVLAGAPVSAEAYRSLAGKVVEELIKTGGLEDK